MRYFFATRADLEPGLKRIDAEMNLKYMDQGWYDTEEPKTYYSGLDLPNLGVGKVNDNRKSQDFLVCPVDTCIVIDEHRSRDPRWRTSYDVDLRYNPRCFSFRSGGVLTADRMQGGQTDVSWDFADVRDTCAKFNRMLVKGFHRIESSQGKAWYVGPEALDLLRQGCMLDDLRIPESLKVAHVPKPKRRTPYSDAQLKIANAKAAGSTELDLSGMRLREIPPEIGDLTSLKVLDACTNLLTTLPPEIGKLSGLERLELYNNRLASLPDEIANLTNLRSLTLGGNLLASLPEAICKISKLEILKITANKLTELPVSIGQLHLLKEIQLGDRLTGLPYEFSALTSLERLELTLEKFQEPPIVLHRLTNLKRLTIKNFKFKEFPVCFSDLRNLEYLELTMFRFTRFPLELKALTKLRTLRLYIMLGSRKLEGLGVFSNLRSLMLRDCSSRVLPDDVWTLSQLRELDIRGNNLTCIPAEIANLTELTDINLGDNGLEMIPPELKVLEKLEGIQMTYWVSAQKICIRSMDRKKYLANLERQERSQLLIE